MICSRCGEAESATEEVFMVGFDGDPDLLSAIDTQLRRSGIPGVNGLAHLCERCWALAKAAFNEGERQYYATRRAFLEEQWERNLGRPLTASERDLMNGYFDGAENPDDRTVV
jgi:hypothetical protein